MFNRVLGQLTCGHLYCILYCIIIIIIIIIIINIIIIIIKLGFLQKTWANSFDRQLASRKNWTSKKAFSTDSR